MAPHDEIELPEGLAELLPGTVWLVGAGPGDPGLLTAYALAGLAQADVVVYDALVDERVLGLARADAQLNFAGKRGGRPSPAQPDISARLIELARDGKRVLRLKGGDPLTFGRGAEEALALVAARIPFRIVPGITAAAGLAYAGIPLTHRATNSAVTLVTGASLAGGVPDELDWAALARGSQALIFYMPTGNIEAIVERLTANGRSPDEPCALVSHVTTLRQKTITATLATLAEAAAKANLEPPSILAVGNIVTLHDKLNWLGRK